MTMSGSTAHFQHSQYNSSHLPVVSRLKLSIFGNIQLETIDLVMNLSMLPAYLVYDGPRHLCAKYMMRIVLCQYTTVLQDYVRHMSQH